MSESPHPREELVHEPAPMSGRPVHRRQGAFFVRIARIGSSAQAAIPGLYAWTITVAPAAWSRGAPLLAKFVAVLGVLALVTAPAIESGGGKGGAGHAIARIPVPSSLAAWTGPTWARVWSVWGFVLTSAVVWALAPSALSSARLDGVRGSLGMVGWALFAFASAGPALKVDPDSAGRIVAQHTSLRPRSELPRGDGVYVAVGVVLALSMQAIGWGVAVPERAVLVRLVTVVCGIAVLSGTTSIALARHVVRTPAPRPTRIRRALPWFVLVVLFGCTGVAFLLLR